MTDKTVITGILLEELSCCSIVDVCEQFQIPEEELLELIENGLFGDIVVLEQDFEFDQEMMSRLGTARRLQKDLELNLPGIILAVELLDEIKQLRNELMILQRHFDKT